MTPLRNKASLALALRSPEVLLVHFTDGEFYCIRGCYPVDPSIYGDSGRWSATVVESVSSLRPNFARLHTIGSGLDFLESDIEKITDQASGVVTYER